MRVEQPLKEGNLPFHATFSTRGSQFDLESLFPLSESSRYVIGWGEAKQFSLQAKDLSRDIINSNEINQALLKIYRETKAHLKVAENDFKG